jgi:ATP-dependent protease Clp ATPase subunit
MKPKIFCSFCRKSDLEVAKMVSDPSGKTHICDECIKVCYSVVNEEPKPAK